MRIESYPEEFISAAGIIDKMNPANSRMIANAGTSHGGVLGVLEATLIALFRFMTAEGRPIAGIAQYAHRTPCLKGFIRRTNMATASDSHPPPVAFISARTRVCTLGSTSFQLCPSIEA